MPTMFKPMQHKYQTCLRFQNRIVGKCLYFCQLYKEGYFDKKILYPNEYEFENS